MDLFDVFRACVRRWYVVLPILFITGIFAHNFYNSVKPVYYSSAVVGIAPSNMQWQYSGNGVPIPRNGLLDTGGATLITNMAVLGYDSSVRAKVVTDGGKGDFIVRMFPVPAVGPQEQLPLILIEATEGDPISAKRTVELAVRQAEPILYNLQQQAGVPDPQMVRALVLSPPTAAAEGLPSRKRSTAGIIGAGLGSAILVAIVFDLLFTWRGRKKSIISDENSLHVANAKAQDSHSQPAESSTISANSAGISPPPR